MAFCFNRPARAHAKLVLHPNQHKTANAKWIPHFLQKVKINLIFFYNFTFNCTKTKKVGLIIRETTVLTYFADCGLQGA